MYEEILPQMQQLLKNIGDMEEIAPGLVHYSASPKILIFKDLATEGFEMSRPPVPFAEGQLLAQKLGKFHALSYFMKEELGDKNLETFTEGMFNETDLTMWNGQEVYVTVLGEMLREWNVAMEKIADKLSALGPEFIQKMAQLYKPNPKGQGINVLNHGDFHIRNVMLRRGGGQDKKTLEAIRFVSNLLDFVDKIPLYLSFFQIDFQLSVYATPAIDLSFLLYVIVDRECRESKRDQLLSIYHRQFKDTLLKLGYLKPIPTLTDFHVELLKNGLMGEFDWLFVLDSS